MSKPILKPGDTVGIVAPGFALDRKALLAGLQTLNRWGFKTSVGKSVRKQKGYFAGDDASRLNDLLQFSQAKEIQAVWFARGGYGTARLLDAFFTEIGRKSLPTYFGFSDATALFNAILSRRDQLCIHAPLVVELAEERKIHKPSLKGLMAGLQYSIPLRKRNVLIAGDAKGRLLGGNLVVLNSLIGTNYFPSLKGAILLLEEVGEEVYRIDRMLTQLRMAGALKGLKGVLFGNCSAPKRKRFPPDRKLKEVLLESFEPLGIPLLWNLPFGHIARQRAVPLGGTVQIEASAQLLTFHPQVHPRRQ